MSAPLFDAWERYYIVNYYRFLGKMKKNAVINRYEFLKSVKALKTNLYRNRVTYYRVYLVVILIVCFIWGIILLWN